MCCILVSKWARHSNGALLNLNMWSSLTVITQSIFQEWQLLCHFPQQLHDIAVINLSYFTYWDWEEPHCYVLLIWIQECNTLVSMKKLALNIQWHCWHESIILYYFIFFMLHYLLFLCSCCFSTLDSFLSQPISFQSARPYILLTCWFYEQR